VLFYDLVRTARRGRHILFRLLYAVVLIGLLSLHYAEHVGRRGGLLWQDWRVPQAQRQEVLRFNESFFQGFMLVQFAVIVLLTPGVTAGSIAEEKDRKTLEFLLTTGLRGHEIVLGKLLSRLAYVILLVLTGLPVLSFLQLLGGVDPKLMLGGFAASALTLLSLACLSMLNSVLAAKPRTAIFAAYMQVAFYFVSSLVLTELYEPHYRPDGVEWYAAGNPYLALGKFRSSIATTGTVATGASIFESYCLFHAILACLCLGGALLGLRVWNRRQASQGSQRAFVVLLKPKRLPPIGPRPVLWKEVYAEPFLRVKRGGMIILTTLWFGCVFFGGLVLLGQAFVHFTAGSFTREVSDTVRRLTVLVGCLSVLGAAIHASGAIAGERDRQTLDSLLTTPLENHAIIWAKWWGSFLSVRKAWYCLAVVGWVGMFTGAMSPFALPVLLVACAVYTAFAASIGLWCSLMFRSSLRAMFWTLLIVVLACGGHRVSTWFTDPIVTERRPRPDGYVTTTSQDWYESFKYFQSYGLTPTTTLNWLASSARDVEGPYILQDRWSHNEASFWPRSSCVAGLLIYLLGIWWFLRSTHHRFARATGRMPFRVLPRMIASPSG
jgi:ABC-type Na+ efflux pump permease subunit